MSPEALRLVERALSGELGQVIILESEVAPEDGDCELGPCSSCPRENCPERAE